jgi:hypothetical protein
MFLFWGMNMIETIMVPVDKKMRRVPVLKAEHLKAWMLLENGTEVSVLVADKKMRRAVNDLCRLGWVKPRAYRY